MSQFSQDAAERLLAAQRTTATVRDRNTRMALRNLIYAVQSLCAAEERREDSSVNLAESREGESLAMGLAQRIVAARAALSEYIAECHANGLSGYVPKQILRADAALKGLDTTTDVGHTAGMDSNAGQED